MKIINLTPNGGSYTMQDWPDHLGVPEGNAVVPEDVDTSAYAEYNGFVTPTTYTEERVAGTHEEPREVTTTNEEGETVTETGYETVEDTITVTIVSAMEGNVEAWEAWKATRPETVRPTPKSVWDELDEAYQEGVNTAYDQ